MVIILFLNVISVVASQFADNPINATHGEVMYRKNDQYNTAQPIQTFYSTSVIECAMRFATEWTIRAMNIVEMEDHVNKSENKIKCEMFEMIVEHSSKISSQLITREGSTYHEKRSKGFMKANPSELALEPKGDKPGIFQFNLPSGMYRIQLLHISGTLICFTKPMNFGCYYNSVPRANEIVMVKDYRGDIVVPYTEFSEYEEDKQTTKFIRTSECFPLVKDSVYSFWYTEDLNDAHEDNNVGRVVFDVYVKDC